MRNYSVFVMTKERESRTKVGGIGKSPRVGSLGALADLVRLMDDDD